MIDVEQELARAVRHFWRTRAKQHSMQGAKTGRKDAGDRAAVTAGKHTDGFVLLVAAIVKDAKLPDFAVTVHTAMRRHRTLPGYFSPV